MEIAIVSILEATGLGVFIYYLFRGLSAKINSLEGVVTAQKQIIEVMDKRIEETEKVGGIYKNLLSDLPAEIDNYKTIISKTKDDVILELKEQKKDTEHKLKEAKEIIQSSGDPQEEIKLHLSVLKVLLSKPETENHKNEYYLKAISEFGDRSLESSVSEIVKARTLDEFFHRLNIKVTITNDDSIMKIVFSKNRKLPNGDPINSAMASHSFERDWHVFANNQAWINEARFSELKDEFSTIKTVA